MGGRRILVADRRVRRSDELIRALEARGYEVVTAASRVGELTPTLRESGSEVVLVDAKHMEELEARLAEALRSRSERAEIARAKDVLMKRHEMSEEEAHRSLRRIAMSRNMRLFDVAQAVVRDHRPG